MVPLGNHSGSSKANWDHVWTNLADHKDGNHDSHLLKLVGGASCHDHGPFCCIYAMVAARRATKQAATTAKTPLCDRDLIESDVFDDFICFHMYFTILS